MTPEKKAWAAEVLVAVVGSEGNRLETGLRRRQMIREAIERGERPTGYRVEWLRQASLAVVSKLKEIGQEFNARNPDDQASVADFLDILANASTYLKEQAGKSDGT